MYGYAGYPPATLAGSALGRTSMTGGMGLAGGMSGPMGGAIESETSQRVIMELLTEFNKVKVRRRRDEKVAGCVCTEV